MKIFKKKRILQDVLEKIQCNFCKVKLHILKDGYISLLGEFGFETKKAFEYHESHICEQCYDKIIKNFKIKPSIFKIEVDNE